MHQFDIIISKVATERIEADQSDLILEVPNFYSYKFKKLGLESSADMPPDVRAYNDEVNEMDLKKWDEIGANLQADDFDINSRNFEDKMPPTF